jgi:hypothetical protein
VRNTTHPAEISRLDIERKYYNPGTWPQKMKSRLRRRISGRKTRLGAQQIGHNGPNDAPSAILFFLETYDSTMPELDGPAIGITHEQQ